MEGYFEIQLKDKMLVSFFFIFIIDDSVCFKLGIKSLHLLFGRPGDLLTAVIYIVP